MPWHHPSRHSGTKFASFRCLSKVVLLSCACADGCANPAAKAVTEEADASAMGLDVITEDESSAVTPRDTSTPDGDLSDGQFDRPQRESMPPPDPYPLPSYVHLSETGFFATAGGREPAGDLMAFEPTYKLWSDGASKRRWVRLPPGTAIDTSDMDHWTFPVGTKVWKEFALDGVTLETRLIERYGTGADDYWMGSFVWNIEQTDAVFAIDGQANINGTTHDAPAQMVCGSCHRGDTGRVLGLSAFQMARRDNSPNLADLDKAGLLTASPASDIGLSSDAATTAALGYLHANCGHCHNDRGTSWRDTQMVLRLKVGEHDVASSDLFQSTVGVKLSYWRGGTVTNRVTAGQPDASAIVARMRLRGKDQMPPLATEQTDDLGLQLVQSWITSLAP